MLWKRGGNSKKIEGGKNWPTRLALRKILRVSILHSLFSYAFCLLLPPPNFWRRFLPSLFGVLFDKTLAAALAVSLKELQQRLSCYIQWNSKGALVLFDETLTTQRSGDLGPSSPMLNFLFGSSAQILWLLSILPLLGSFPTQKPKILQNLYSSPLYPRSHFLSVH